MAANVLIGGGTTPVIVTGGRAVPLIVVNPARGATLSAPYIPVIKLEAGEDAPVGYVGLVVREQ